MKIISVHATEDDPSMPEDYGMDPLIDDIREEIGIVIVIECASLEEQSQLFNSLEIVDS